MELCTHEKSAFFLPVNILMVWLPAFLATRQTKACLDFTIILGYDTSYKCTTYNL